MPFGSDWMARLAPAAIVVKAIVVSAIGISALLIFIVLRRWWRGRYYARRDRQTFAMRRQWSDLVSGKIAPETWRFDPLACEVMESLLLDGIETANQNELPALVDCLRRGGLIDRRVVEARTAEGWQRRRALVALGRTRAPETVPALAEALDSSNMETRIAAVRGMGKLALTEAAAAMLDRFTEGRLIVPWSALKNALLSCCARKPEVLLRYVENTGGTQRELLARVLAEIAEPSMGDELLVMAADSSAELRAAAARALARLEARIAVPALAQLAGDPEWFVRLRAVVALGSFSGADVVTVLIRGLGDRNRLVRQRTAWALMNSGEALARVLRQVVEAGDNYGLQAVVTELERSGRYFQALAEVKQEAGLGAERLVDALQEARGRLALAVDAEIETVKAGTA